MNTEILLVLAVIVVLFTAFVQQKVPQELAALAAASFLLLTGVINTQELLGVFSNPAAMTVAAMFILSAALDKTGVIDYIGKASIDFSNTHGKKAIAGIFLFVFLISFFINNTSVVLIMIPVMGSLAAHLKIAPSKLLIPLSYASIFGGACTLLGTSTNLLVDGAAQKMDVQPFSVFEIFIPGLVLAIAGSLYMLFVGRYLLPERKTLTDIFDTSHSRRYLTQIHISQESPLLGKTLAESGFTSDKGFEVIRHATKSDEEENFGTVRAFASRILLNFVGSGTPERPVDMAAVLQEGDRVVVLSDTRNVVNIQEPVVKGPHQDILKDNTVIMEGIVSPQSRFIGKSVKDINAENGYNIIILAVHRNNDALDRDFENLTISAADTILIRGEEEALALIFENEEVINLTRPHYEPYRKSHAVVAISVLLVAVGTAALNILPIAGAAFVGAVIVVMAGCIRIQDAYSALNGSVLLLIYAMLAISVAVQNSGALDLVAYNLFKALQGMPPIVVLSLLYLFTSIITEFFSNNVAALVITPIAVALAQNMGLEPKAFAAVIMFASSASFATPMGYQTNLLVFHAGGYKFSDFLKVGVPLNLIMWLAATFVVPLYWGL